MTAKFSVTITARQMQDEGDAAVVRVDEQLKKDVGYHISQHLPHNTPAAIQINRRFDHPHRTSNATVQVEVFLKEYPPYRERPPFGDISRLTDISEKIEKMESLVRQLVKDIQQNSTDEQSIVSRQSRGKQLLKTAGDQLKKMDTLRLTLMSAVATAELALHSATAIKEDAIFGEPEPEQANEDILPF